jgi:hypothetical protein
MPRYIAAEPITGEGRVVRPIRFDPRYKVAMSTEVAGTGYAALDVIDRFEASVTAPAILEWPELEHFKLRILPPA